MPGSTKHFATLFAAESACLGILPTAVEAAIGDSGGGGAEQFLKETPACVRGICSSSDSRAIL